METYYSDHSREQLTAECEYHEGERAWPSCEQCNADFDAWAENLEDDRRHGL